MNRRVALVAMIAAVLAVAIIAAVFVLQPAQTTVPARIAHYTLAADGRRLTVTVTLTRLETIASSRAEESSSTVKVIILVSRRTGTAPFGLELVDVPFTLASTLDGRTVVDASDTPVPAKRTGTP